MERDEAKRLVYMEKVREIPEEKLVYIDESGFDAFIFRPYGRAPRGKRVAGKVSGRKFKRTNLIAGKCGKKILAPMQHNGTADSVLFECWFEKYLLKEVVGGCTIVLDNASFHRKPKIIELAAKAGCSVLFLPPYSPDLNPIEKFWAWLKRRLQEVLPYFPSFDLAMADCFQVL